MQLFVSLQTKGTVLLVCSLFRVVTCGFVWWLLVVIENGQAITNQKNRPFGYKGKNRPPLTFAVSKCQPWSGHSHRLQTGVPERGDNARVEWRLALTLLWRCRRFRLKPDIISKIRTARSWIGVQHGISRATGKQHKAMCRACGSAGHWHGLSPKFSYHLGASGGDKVVWGNTLGALPHAPVTTACLTAPLFWWHWFLKHE